MTEIPLARRRAISWRRSLGTMTCKTDTTAMTCIDNATGHYFRLARDTYEIG